MKRFNWEREGYSDYLMHYGVKGMKWDPSKLKRKFDDFFKERAERNKAQARAEKASRDVNRFTKEVAPNAISNKFVGPVSRAKKYNKGRDQGRDSGSINAFNRDKKTAEKFRNSDYAKRQKTAERHGKKAYDGYTATKAAENNRLAVANTKGKVKRKALKEGRQIKKNVSQDFDKYIKSPISDVGKIAKNTMDSGKNKVKKKYKDSVKISEKTTKEAAGKFNKSLKDKVNNQSKKNKEFWDRQNKKAAPYTDRVDDFNDKVYKFVNGKKRKRKK